MWRMSDPGPHGSGRRRLVAGGVVLGAVALALLVVASMDRTARERLVGDTVEARIGDYVGALMRDDLGKALDAWQLDPRRMNDPAIGARRDATTAALRDLRVRRYGIEEIEWWRTCCEPGPIDDPANAGLARAVVRLDSEKGSDRYVFDVVARTTTYWGDAGGGQPHEWTLRDVYPSGAAPLFIRVSHATMFPDAVEAVRRYYDRYAEALVGCDIRRLWDHYPAPASGTDLAAGINIEEAHVRGWCGGVHLAAATFELEARAPLRIHERRDGLDVTVHGLCVFDSPGGPSLGEFTTTISLQRSVGTLTVVRTDELTLGELRERTR